MPKSMTQEMIEAGIGSLGDDDSRPTALVVSDMYAAIRSASPAPGEEVRSVLEAAAQDVLDSSTRPSAKELTTAFLCALGGEE
jgi:hypothetical protein